MAPRLEEEAKVVDGSLVATVVRGLASFTLTRGISKVFDTRPLTLKCIP